MTANDVYNIATALPEKELQRLLSMLEVKKQPEKVIVKKKKQKPLPDFTVEDGIRLLLKTHFSKIRTI